jgi:hypothetical protein
VDRTPPRPFGTGVEPADKLWWPGDEISMTFTEDVQCDRPFRFGSSIEVGGVRINITNPVDVICESTKVRFAFSRTLIQMSEALVGKDVTMRITDVPDLALNTVAESSWSFAVGAFALDKASVKLTDVRVPFDAIGSGSSADISSAVARLLLGANGPLAQITVSPLTVARKRGLTRSFNVDVKSAESSGASGVGAMSIANTILGLASVDTSQTQVALSAPGDPGALPAPTTYALVLDFFSTGLGIAVIVIVIVVVLLVATVVGVIVCIVMSQRHRIAAATAAPPPSSGTEMRNDFRRAPSRRSRRSVRAPEGDEELAPSAYAPPQARPNPTTPSLPAPFAKSESARRRSSRRKESSRRRKMEQPYGQHRVLPPPPPPLAVNSAPTTYN